VPTNYFDDKLVNYILMAVLTEQLCMYGVLRYCPVGRSFYSPALGRRQPLGEGLETWRGFYQSIRPTQMGLSLNIGTCFSFLTHTICIQLLFCKTKTTQLLAGAG